ncbi:hypothetical protein ACNKHM_16565 [Shigella sonnei]
MRKHTDVIAMTNGMNVANALLEAEGVELLDDRGHLRRQSQSFYGDQAEQSLQNYHFDMLVSWCRCDSFGSVRQHA